MLNVECWVEGGFGRAVSRILSSPFRAERIICLSSQYPEPGPLSRTLERAAPRSPIWPCTRWGFPCRVACASRGALLPHLFTLALRGFQIPALKSEIHGVGGLIFCGTFRQKVFQLSARVYRSVNFKFEIWNFRRLRGIAPCGVRTFLLHPAAAGWKRSSALPKPPPSYAIIDRGTRL